MKSSTQFSQLQMDSPINTSYSHLILYTNTSSSMTLGSSYNTVIRKNCSQTRVNPTLLFPTTSTRLNSTCTSRNSVPIITY
ncbi:hypothetical protein WG66_012471, partial [Moniliophthora roreri]